MNEYQEQLQKIAKEKGISFDNLLTQIEQVSQSKIFDEMLDECYDMIKVCGYEYYPSHVLESTDPIAYRCGLTDYLDSLEQDDIVVSFDNGCSYYLVSDVEDFIENCTASEV